MRVIQPKTVSEKLLYSTVRITNDSGTGTGFFFSFINESQSVELILTNKHVVDINKKIEFYLHEAKNNSGTLETTDQSFSLTIDNCSALWIPHPDENVDLGALLFGPIRQHAKDFLKKEIYSVFLNENLIKDDSTLERESDVSDEVLMIGYPNGLWDDYNNLPIMRKGIAASHPALDFQGKSIGVVDIACFPGSSGSPILIHMNGYNDKSGNYLLGTCKTILLGLLYAGPYHTDEGLVEIKEIPTNSISMVSTRQMIHLGYYVKAREILALCEVIKVIPGVNFSHL